ncbi:GIY-YIG nuclease family protein [Candidatus Nitrotoga sp. 1052]|uniref:GIY-YIG nuclease family protein n=1 Tax=Candidatus Nitrotoga sp. 1052 TaxID=2886964 RepID=UPI001EF59D15|nr:GIY-YIG nuclease family protein [Candidatus Nitrotoga sp. 1052]CAH1074579.1 Excinuclease ABC, C subunit-like [Candidatus Nitrotoga sp. 1052]
MGKTYYVYLLTNWNNKVMYIGVTSNLELRVYEHKNKLVEGFTQKYNVNKLVSFESTNDVLAAIEREKQIKKWRREKKNQLVTGMNPEWKDLSLEWGKDFSLQSK